VTNVGIDLVVAGGDAPQLRAALIRAGAEEVGAAAAEILRVETGRPRFGTEMTTSTIPEEAGINDRAVSLTKGCYIGQETVARLHYKGKSNRHLRGLRLDSETRADEAIQLGDREVGRVGTAVLSPAFGPIALAILRREATPGDQVAVGPQTIAEVVELPFSERST
jgi:folate-binding protein YgfZ